MTDLQRRLYRELRHRRQATPEHEAYLARGGEDSDADVTEDDYAEAFLAAYDRAAEEGEA